MFTTCQRLLCFLLIFGNAAGCATLNNRGAQTLIANATDQEQGIQIEVITSDGAYLSTLPNTIVGRSSWSGITINVVDECYEKTSYDVSRSISRSYWANIIFLYGFLIDPLTGYWWNYEDHARVPVTKKTACSKKTGTPDNPTP